MMHLTNYAINKMNPEYEYATTEDGNDSSHKRSFTSVLELLRQEGHNTDLLLKKIYDIIVKTIISV
jgi:hypothetical protein